MHGFEQAQPAGHSTVLPTVIEKPNPLSHAQNTERENMNAPCWFIRVSAEHKCTHRCNIKNVKYGSSIQLVFFACLFI